VQCGEIQIQGTSGMRVRLAYAVAAHLNADGLLVDEVLAVGDIAYQRKCVNHMLRYLDPG
jgi:lipopolysaccharide transport system ATP-binding protein